MQCDEFKLVSPKYVAGSCNNGITQSAIVQPQCTPAQLLLPVP